ncbi:MAG: DUF4397 domain-containing protein [Anaerolineae bacterium]|nr:DUF4397 domain-containing protein [Anaerolineae bacterium]
MPTIFLSLWVVMIVLAACEPTIPNVPAITVVITAVDDTDALADAVTREVGATVQAWMGETATVMAQGGVTLTPSITPTPTVTETPSPTRFVTNTPTRIPSETPTSTYAPFDTNTPSAPIDPETAWVRVAHAWREVGSLLGQTTPVDVYINDERVERNLDLGEASNYLQVAPGAVRVSIRPVDADVSNAAKTPPLASTVVEIAPGGVVTTLVLNSDPGARLLPLQEDPAPLPSGLARLTVVQSNSVLLPVNMLLLSQGRALGYNFSNGDVVGPVDMPSESYIIDLYDAEEPAQQIMPLPPMTLANRVSYILVLVPPSRAEENLSGTLLFTSTTRRVSTDIGARFINLAQGAGPITIRLDGQNVLSNFPVGSISDSIPVSYLGSTAIVTDSQDRPIFSNQLGPWTVPEEQGTDKIVMFVDGPSTSGSVQLGMTVFSQNPPPSAINASIRLIHGLPNTLPLILEIRPVRTTSRTNEFNTPVFEQIGEDVLPWVVVGRSDFGQASVYVGKTPELYDIRVRLEGSPSTIGELKSIQLLAGGTYDFIAVPGPESGSADLVLLQPDVQITSLSSGEGNPTAVYEAVAATLTAQAPQITSTPTRSSTATPTGTPIATNTPRPSNTPSIPPPLLGIIPSAPNTTASVVTLDGLNFSPNQPYQVTLDDSTTPIFDSTTNGNGSITDSLQLPADTLPGPHILRVCVDCQRGPRGANQTAYAVVLVASLELTPSPTPEP